MSSHRVQLMGMILLFSAGTAWADRAQQNGRDPDRTLSPYFLVEGDAGTEAFPLKSTSVKVDVAGVIADVTVTQLYENSGSSPINARYVFPASTRAAVHGMTFRIGEKMVRAKVKEREQAKQEFAEAKRGGKSAALLEQDRPNVFTMSLANVMPNDRVLVELKYSELLVPTEGLYQFVYPTVVGPRYSNRAEAQAQSEDHFVKSPYLHEGEAPTSSFEIGVVLSTGLPLLDVGCATHDVDVAWDNPSLARVSLKGRDRSGGNRDFILDYRLAGKQIQSGLLLHEGSDESFFLLMLQPPAAVRTEEIPVREYIFVLDVSGSMAGYPLDTAKEVIAKLLTNLRPTDTFNVALFAGASELMARESLPATADNIRQALDLIERAQGGGGTELEAALRVATKIPRHEHVSRSITVVTDGFIAEEEGAFELIRHNLHHTNFFAFGIGASVNRYLIEGMARVGQGEPFVVTGPQDAAAAADRFRKYIETPVLTGIKVTFDGFDAYDVEPPAQPDLFAERPVILFGKWKGQRHGAITVSGRRANGEFAQTFRVAETPPQESHRGLAQLWARSRIARLSDFGFQQHDSNAVAEVTSLGLTYSLLTRYTSFIAVIEEVRNRGGAATDVDQPLPLPEGVSDLAVAGYQNGDEPELWMLLMLVLAGTAVLAWRRGLKTTSNA